EDKLFDPALLQTNEWKKFTSEIKRISEFAEDDATYVLAFFYLSHKYLPFSHFALYHPLDDSRDVQREKFVTLNNKGHNTMYMRVTSFGGEAEEMDSAFSEINKAKYGNLII